MCLCVYVCVCVCGCVGVVIYNGINTIIEFYRRKQTVNQVKIRK